MARTTLLKACLNGNRDPGSHPSLPIAPGELAREAERARAAGAGAVHVHPRGDDGLESLDPRDVGGAIAAIRKRCPGLPVGVTTGAWIEPDPERRLALVRRWREPPDFASVNFSEPGAAELCELLFERGIGVEAGLTTTADARVLAWSRLGPRCLRVLLEPQEADAEAAIWRATAIDVRLGRARMEHVPFLTHGQEAATWPVLRFAVGRGHDVRIGLEDTFEMPDGSAAPHNATLVDAARRLVEGRRRDRG